MQTRETYIQAVREAVIVNAPDLTPPEAAMLRGLKVVYGSGSGTGARGVTYYGAWNGSPLTPPADDCGPDCGHASTGSLVELCAFGEESVAQLCGTTVHELAHALAGPGTGHGAEWKRACVRLGLRRAKAAGTTYRAAMFAPALRAALVAVPLPDDGKPLAGWGAATFGAPAATGSCSHGRGSRGGKSRGKGSGSRLRKWTCDCGVIVRVASDDFRATCDRCGCAFKREEKADGGDALAALAALVGGA